ncbi:MAG TPA: alanine--glyoxylate aminotransferase family protein [Dehalococcoidia bacterium]|nr:alanine--glyoxylate aminotransferase family protein [Dehalococcoidia bacterium]
MTTEPLGELNVPHRLLLGPGPSGVHPRVYRAMQQPVIGYLDPAFIQLMDDTQRPLRTIFRTENDLTMPISGTGTAGMEAAVYNIVEPGDNVVVCMNGFFGTRLAEMARRCGATVFPVEAEWGRIIEPEQVSETLQKAGRTKAVMIVHGETSTGILQPLEDVSRITHEAGALLVVDAVTSLSGCELLIDEWGIDICYAGTQKCLSAPPGMAPLTVSQAAMDVIQSRTVPVASFYVDLTILGRYWAEGSTTRMYHHTPPMTMLYALREGLRIVMEEGLEARIARHKRNANALIAGVTAMGMTLHAQPEYRLPPLTTVGVPDGVDERQLRMALLQNHNIEVGGGIGDLAGQILRIGLMGFNSTAQNVLGLLFALEIELLALAVRLDKGAGVAAVVKYYDEN